MGEFSKRQTEVIGNTADYLLAKQKEQYADSHRVKVVIFGCGYTGVAVAISLLFKRLTSELVLIDTNENLARAEAADISHAGAFLGNPKIVGTKDYSAARDAAVCVVAAGGNKRGDQNREDMLRNNVNIMKSLIPNVCKFAPSSILVIVSNPVDILSYVAMKLSGFPPNRIIGLGTFLDSCRFQYYISQKLGVAPSSVQAIVIGENSEMSVPIWSAVTVMGMKLKDINKEIGTKYDPEGWNDLHNKVINSTNDLIRKKGYCCWGAGLCVAEIVDAIIRNTCTCITVSTFIKGCKHGFEKDIFMSLPCVVGRNGVQSNLRFSYTEEEQELTALSCRSIYESQKSILDLLEVILMNEAGQVGEFFHVGSLLGSSSSWTCFSRTG